jgi:hypothetical protein
VTDILSADVQQFIREHENDDERKLLLKHSSLFGLPATMVIQQIVGRRKAKEKLPTFYHTPGIIYPPGINLEQSSSEQTAKFKIQAIESLFSERNRMIDLTGGFGVDSFFFSRIFSSVDYVEPNAPLLDIVRQNHHRLGAENIRHHATSAEAFLHELNDRVDLMYIDPSRRTENRKVSSLVDSVPDVVALQPGIFAKTDHLLLKASPLLDLSAARKSLSNVKRIFVVSVNNECRELLFFCEHRFVGEPLISAVNIADHAAETFEFTSSKESSIDLPFADPKVYLYEPNASILKAGGFKSVAIDYQLDKIQVNTHLYTSSGLREDFPGRIFRIEAFVKPSPKELRNFFPEEKTNITTRNYPLTVAELRKKTGLKEGGEKFLIGFSGQREKFLVAASRVK